METLQSGSKAVVEGTNAVVTLEQRTTMRCPETNRTYRVWLVLQSNGKRSYVRETWLTAV